MSKLTDKIDRHLDAKPEKAKQPKQAKLPGFSTAQMERLEAAIETYQGAKDRLDAAVATHKEAVDEATLALIEVMRDLKQKTIFIEGVEVSVLDLVKVKVKGRKTARRDAE
jgi:hypothetical protein